MKKILFISSEATPFVSTGGLGDVIGSLPAALKKSLGESADIRVAIPFYSTISAPFRSEAAKLCELTVDLAWRKLFCAVYTLKKDNIIFYFIDNEYYFKPRNLYGEFNDFERFSFFSKAIFHLMHELEYVPDILHANDWQTAPALLYLKAIYSKKSEFSGIRSVFTIHNILYQGKFDCSLFSDVLGIGNEYSGLAEYDGCINLLKAGIECADRITTVSQKYSAELLDKDHSAGLQQIIQKNSHKLYGILNGIDYSYYDPQHSVYPLCQYSAEDLTGKNAIRARLLTELGLTALPSAPVISVISRLVTEKGLDILASCADELLNHNVILIILGTGEATLENYFKELEKKHSEKVRCIIGYDRALSKKIYAGSDIFVMPSRTEPCGLAQMIASRYGTIPVVRSTGGLSESIKEVRFTHGRCEGNGFLFDSYSPNDLLSAVFSAITLWEDKIKRDILIKKIMLMDFSWNASAKKYIRLYDELF